MNLETHLDHLTRQDEYLNRRLSQCERDTTHINNVLNQLPTFDQIESLITRTLAAQAGNILPRMNNNEITENCEPSTIHPDLPMSGNHDSDRRSMALQYLHIMKTTITMTQVIHVSMTWTMLMQILLPLFLYLKLLHYQK